MIGRTVLVAVEICGPAVRGQENIRGAIVVDIAVRCAAANDRPFKTWSNLRHDVFKPVTAQVVEEVRHLTILDARLDLLDLILDVAVRDEEVRPAVEIEVKEEQTEGKTQQRRSTDRRTRRLIDEEPVSLVVIQPEHLSSEVSDRNARQTGLIVIRPVDTHCPSRNASCIRAPG